MRILPPDLLAKIKEQNQTIFNNANPKMNVVVARAKSSIRDSSYFTIETIRTKEGITDVSVAARRMEPIGRPDRIYSIHIDNGVAKTSIREYPDKLKEHWKYQFDVGPAKLVSIVFDARWHLNKYKRWGMATDEKPYIFWVGTDDKLYTRIWDLEETQTQLAENVVKLDTARGWIPAQTGHTDDQGIIAVYVKTDGKVYYRNYCMQADGVTFVWELEREITEFGTNNLGVRLFRTNDFRIGIIAEKATGNIMAISKRNYAGMSIAPEKLHARVSAAIEFIPLEFTDVVSPDEYLSADVRATTYLCPVDKLDVEPISISRPSNTELSITFDTDLFNVDTDGFVVTNESGLISYEISTVAFNSGTKKLLITVSSAMDANSNIKVNYFGDNILVVDDDYCKLELNPFEVISEGLPQDGYLKEYLTANVTAEITMTKLVFSEGFTKEYLTASVSATIQFWHIDDAPV